MEDKPTRKLTVECRKTSYSAWQAMASSEGRSLSNWVNRALDNASRVLYLSKLDPQTTGMVAIEYEVNPAVAEPEEEFVPKPSGKQAKPDWDLRFEDGVRCFFRDGVRVSGFRRLSALASCDLLPGERDFIHAKWDGAK